ncbi:MAG: DUF4271 domain-containing protein [Niabella sp.]
MRQLSLITLFIFIAVTSYGQKTDSSKEKTQQKKEVTVSRELNPDTTRPNSKAKNPQKKDSTVPAPATRSLKTDSVLKHQPDTLINKKPKKTLIKPSHTKPVQDTVKKAEKTDSLPVKTQQSFLLTQKILAQHPFFNYHAKAVYPPYTRKAPDTGKDIYFYLIAGLLLSFAIYKAAFDKYFSDLIHLFFRRSLKQRQLKQQLIQNSLPSLLLNILFVLISGFYTAMLIQAFIIKNGLPFWQLFVYCTTGISLIYIGKYFTIRFIGWVFGIGKLADNYIFIIFLVNKILALFLIPLIIIIALSNKELSTVAWTLSWLVISGLLFYRYFSAVGLIRKEGGISFFHFLLYICAFEILPTIVIYKAILSLLK